MLLSFMTIKYLFAQLAAAPCAIWNDEPCFVTMDQSKRGIFIQVTYDHGMRTVFEDMITDLEVNGKLITFKLGSGKANHIVEVMQHKVYKDQGCETGLTVDDTAPFNLH